MIDSWKLFSGCLIFIITAPYIKNAVEKSPKIIQTLFCSFLAAAISGLILFALWSLVTGKVDPQIANEVIRR